MPLDTTRLDLTPNELTILSNALNEICNGIDLHGEFDTRIGAGIEDARRLLARLLKLQTDRP
jgi:hypothetical protein